MSKLTLPLSLVFLGMVIGLSLQLWYWPQLPERMAIHFDANGTPNDWMGKVPATLLSISLVTLLPMFFFEHQSSDSLDANFDDQPATPRVLVGT